MMKLENNSHHQRLLIDRLQRGALDATMLHDMTSSATAGLLNSLLAVASAGACVHHQAPAQLDDKLDNFSRVLL